MILLLRKRPAFEPTRGRLNLLDLRPGQLRHHGEDFQGAYQRRQPHHTSHDEERHHRRRVGEATRFWPIPIPPGVAADLLLLGWIGDRELIDIDRLSFEIVGGTLR